MDSTTYTLIILGIITLFAVCGGLAILVWLVKCAFIALFIQKTLDSSPQV